MRASTPRRWNARSNENTRCTVAAAASIFRVCVLTRLKYHAQFANGVDYRNGAPAGLRPQTLILFLAPLLGAGELHSALPCRDNQVVAEIKAIPYVGCLGTVVGQQRPNASNVHTPPELVRAGAQLIRRQVAIPCHPSESFQQLRGAVVKSFADLRTTGMVITKLFCNI